MPDIDFGYSQHLNDDGSHVDKGNGGNEDTINITTGKVDHDINGVPVEDLGDTDANKGVKLNEDGDRKNDDTIDNKGGNNGDKDESLAPGTTIEVGEDIYTVDENGNVVDKDGNVFKEAKDVKAWLDEFDKVDPNKDFTIENIQEAVGVTITDDKDNPVKYENTIEGVKSYLNDVIETSKQEHYETAINTLYQKYPFLGDIIDYYVANGNSLKGFNEIPDRSSITIDETNEAQQESIIRMAWEEQGRKGDVNNYINYLKSTGTLLATAKEELAGMQEADEQYRKQLEEEARKKEQEETEKAEKYWNGVHDVIKSRKIAGYEIPEQILITRNGQKITVTPEDFFNYLYRVDKDGYSAYERDLANRTAESVRDDSILRAYLMFVGGNYSNLVSMAINKDKVAELRLKAKENNKAKARINKPQPNKKSGANIDFGYN